ncbi:MAG TPA: hypothetical protein VH352_13595 [Pseudonocardiaceae bacterium]|jgi:hypothetical protein|nr:hypothetical protein [Pseudonocardiaceae bacterium]
MVDGTNAINNDVNRTSGFAPPIESIEALGNGAQQLLAAANGGQLAFDPQTGQSLVRALKDAINELNLHVTEAGRLVLSTPLGMTAGGRAISKFNDEVATTGPNAFRPAHQQFVMALSSAVEAVQIAMDTYLKTEQHTTQSFTPTH